MATKPTDAQALASALSDSTIFQSRSRVDGDRWIEAAVRQLLVAVGEDPMRDGLANTPARVRRSMLELTAGYKEDPAAILATTFEADHDEMVVVRAIPFYSQCEHHWLPFFGTVTIGYIPKNGRIAGLSKLVRLVDCFSRRLQVQERMTKQIATAIETHLTPLGVGVLAEARHLCMEMRGVESCNSPTITSALLGAMREQPATRAEFLELARAGR